MVHPPSIVVRPIRHPTTSSSVSKQQLKLPFSDDPVDPFWPLLQNFNFLDEFVSRFVAGASSLTRLSKEYVKGKASLWKQMKEAWDPSLASKQCIQVIHLRSNMSSVRNLMWSGFFLGSSSAMIRSSKMVLSRKNPPQNCGPDIRTKLGGGHWPRKRYGRADFVFWKM